MARVRNLSPGFFTNEQLVELPFEYRLLFAGLWTIADREGRLEDRPKRIRMTVFPADNVDCDAGIQALHDGGMVLRYTVAGVRYIQILEFAKHQKPHPRETQSVIPAPEGAPKASLAPHAMVDPEQDQGSPEADLGSPEDDEGFVGPGGLSDSRTLGLSEGEIPREPATAVEIAIAMRRAGVEANGSHPEVIAVAGQKVAIETVVAACEEAKTRLPGQRVPVTYVTQILATWAKRAAETEVRGAVPPQARASPYRSAADAREERDGQFMHALTGGLAGRLPQQPRTIDGRTDDLPALAAPRD